MTDAAESAPSRSRIAARTLVNIRWIAIFGQSVALLSAYAFFGLSLPYVLTAAIVAGAAVLNLVAHSALPARPVLSAQTAAAYLAFDMTELTLLLHLTGGLSNPFSILLLAPMTVAAAALDVGRVVGLVILLLGCVTLLAIMPSPLHWDSAIPHLAHDFAIWGALILATLFIAGYVWTIARQSARISDALAAMEQALDKERRASALGALAAAAAHELGSPLSTIAIVAQEIATAQPKGCPLREDAELLKAQTTRCRDILAQLAARPTSAGEPAAYTLALPLTALISEAFTPYRRDGVELLIYKTADRQGAEPALRPSPELMHGLANVLQNAVQFATKSVAVTLFWDKSHIRVTVHDDGPGYPPSLLARLGEPYLSTRQGEQGHMGLGVFIAVTLLSSLGGTVRFANPRSGGAEVTIDWDRPIRGLEDV
jgi:two-component system, sensor histidine kinase RegB